MDYEIITSNGSNIRVNGVARITRKGWLFSNKIIFWAEGELPLAVFRDYDVDTLLAVQDGMVLKRINV